MIKLIKDNAYKSVLQNVFNKTSKGEMEKWVQSYVKHVKQR